MAGANAEIVREKDSKINELIEELGNKELLLSEAQAQLVGVREAGGWVREGAPHPACGAASH